LQGCLDRAAAGQDRLGSDWDVAGALLPLLCIAGAALALAALQEAYLLALDRLKAFLIASLLEVAFGLVLRHPGEPVWAIAAGRSGRSARGRRLEPAHLGHTCAGSDHAVAVHPIPDLASSSGREHVRGRLDVADSGARPNAGRGFRRLRDRDGRRRCGGRAVWVDAQTLVARLRTFLHAEHVEGRRQHG